MPQCRAVIDRFLERQRSEGVFFSRRGAPDETVNVGLASMELFKLTVHPL